MTPCTGMNQIKNAKHQTYFLPIIHIGIKSSPGRPFVSANGCSTENISYLVDHFLNLPSTHNKLCVKETTHFVKIIRNTLVVPQNNYLLTLNMTSLYVNICIPTQIQAAQEALDKFRPQPGVKSTNKSLIQLLEMVLTKNNFQFINQHDLQINRFAVSTSVATALPKHTWPNLKMIVFIHITYNHFSAISG